MPITRYRFSDRILTLPNSKHFFRNVKTDKDHLKIIRSFDCVEIAEVHISSIGTFGFIFHDSGEFASIDILKLHGSGTVPDEVIQSNISINNLQEKRILFVNFLAAAFFGRLCGKNGMALVGANYSGQDKISNFEVVQHYKSIQPQEFIFRSLEEKINSIVQGFLVSDSDIDNAINFVQGTLLRQSDFEYTDLQNCMVMNYQAAILHCQQHFAASLSLNFLVVESLIQEIFMVYGLVGNSQVKQFATKTHSVSKQSRSEFAGKTVNQLVGELYKGKLLDDYLYKRITDSKTARNGLMHKGRRVSPEDSGTCQTVVRDLWAFLLDAPFELISGWSYMR
jgi:hypothetical protein